VATDTGVEANARLTGYVAMALLALLAIAFATGLVIRRDLLLHVVVGFAAIPPLLLKFGSVGYRFVRYYTKEPRYLAAGTPTLGMRILAPVLVLLTVIVFGSGVELWVFGYRFGSFWIPVHHGSAYLWFIAAAIHVVSYARRAPSLLLADWRDDLRGALTRRSVVIASLVLGGALAVTTLSFASPFALSTGGS
jgi:hypothetical protein